MNKFCCAKSLDSEALGFLSVKNKNWVSGSIINFTFLDNLHSDLPESYLAKQKSAVFAIMRELESLAFLKFELVDNVYDSDIRISFIAGNGSWSYLGTDALSIPKTDPTLNFGWDVSNDFGTVRHELGHAIGLGHEHSNPENPIQWNKPHVIDVMREVGWTEQDVIYQIFRLYIPSQINLSTSRDSYSVMHYFFPSSWTLNGESVTVNDNWSKLDKEFLLKLYPFPEVKESCDMFKDALKSIFMTKSSFCIRKKTLIAVANALKIDPTGKKIDILKSILKFLNS